MAQPSSRLQLPQVPALGSGEAFPVGSVFLSVVSTDPSVLLGYGTWAALGAGRVLIGQDTGDTDFDTLKETGGAKTVTSTGAVSGHTHAFGTIAVADHAAHVHSGSADHASHTHTYTDVVNHKHTYSVMFRTATTGSDTTQIAVTQDTSSTKDQTNQSDNPVGGVATGTTAGPSATLTHGNTGNNTTTLSHTVSGSTASTTPTYTGNATSVVQPYLVVKIWERTA